MITSADQAVVLHGSIPPPQPISTGTLISASFLRPPGPVVSLPTTISALCAPGPPPLTPSSTGPATFHDTHIAPLCSDMSLLLTRALHAWHSSTESLAHHRRSEESLRGERDAAAPARSSLHALVSTQSAQLQQWERLTKAADDAKAAGDVEIRRLSSRLLEEQREKRALLEDATKAHEAALLVQRQAATREMAELRASLLAREQSVAAATGEMRRQQAALQVEQERVRKEKAALNDSRGDERSDAAVQRLTKERAADAKRLERLERDNKGLNEQLAAVTRERDRSSNKIADMESRGRERNERSRVDDDKNHRAYSDDDSEEEYKSAHKGKRRRSEGSRKDSR